jgi:hypothetical protein
MYYLFYLIINESNKNYKEFRLCTEDTNGFSKNGSDCEK